MLTQAPRGTKDVLPTDSYRWQHVEAHMRKAAAEAGFREVRTPVFEHTELFLRGVGDTTDIVQKEMYTFEDREGRSLTLRPEGTAGVARAMIEHGRCGGVLPEKLFYFINCFRYEAPQAGRSREFFQFGTEMFGASGMHIKEYSPYAMTFICTLGNGHLGYVPSLLGYTNGGYSTDITRLAPGGGERIVGDMLAILNELHD